MPDADVIRNAVDAYIDALNRRDRTAFLALFSEQAEQADPVGEPPRVGRGAIGAWWDDSVVPWDRFVITRRELYVAGNAASLVWTIEEELDRRSRTFRGVDVLAFDDDANIASVHAYWERTTMPPLA